MNILAHPFSEAFDRNIIDEMLERQRQLQIEFMGGDPGLMEGEERKTFFTAMSLALIAEVIEVGQEIAWKPWAKTNHLDIQAYTEELVDVWHFFMNLMLVADIDADAFVQAYYKKVAVNEQRQRDGYTGLDKGGVSGGKL